MKKLTTLSLAFSFGLALASTAQAQVKFGMEGPITGANAAIQPRVLSAGRTSAKLNR